MDQFGVLVESIGFKSNGRSVPMADLKNKPKTNNGFPLDLGLKSDYLSNSNFVDGSFIDDLDGIFKSTTNSKPQNYDDIFGGPEDTGSMFDMDSVFSGSGLYDDVFGKMPGLKSSERVNFDNVFGSIGKKSDSIDDLLGDFGGMGLKPNASTKSLGKMEENVYQSDDLIPGFGNGEIKEKEERVTHEQRLKEKDKSQKRFGEEAGVFETANDLESFFSMGSQSTQRQRSTTEDPVFDALFQNREKSKVERGSSGTSYSTNKVTSVTNSVDDFSLFFGTGAAPLSGDFHDIPGESEERRKARLKHHKNTQERMAKALEQMNQRDRQNQIEQEERHRLAETLNDGIKRWAAGKEGNLRALLSSLQYVLWPECGWEPVSLTDLITSVSVKKVYFKATLCVHPDKVQQRGANLQQKYIAEKVFDLLKEAWNKFNSEEF